MHMEHFEICILTYNQFKKIISECSAQGQIFHSNAGTKIAALSSTANSGTKVVVLLGINRCGSFPLLPHPTPSLSSEKIPGAPTWKWGEWMRLTGPSGLHRNLSQGLNISSIRVFDIWNYIDQLNKNLVLSLFLRSRILSWKFIKLRQLKWKFKNSDKLSPSVP